MSLGLVFFGGGRQLGGGKFTVEGRHNNCGGRHGGRRGASIGRQQGRQQGRQGASVPMWGRQYGRQIFWGRQSSCVTGASPPTGGVTGVKIFIVKKFGSGPYPRIADAADWGVQPLTEPIIIIPLGNVTFNNCLYSLWRSELSNLTTYDGQGER
ncbi:hypothetical protein B0H16DRAFT_1476288 [Mycena metata]|uniref:Uncharacterized protein n=1 Tax=Mycena metata TaxID=1033252 RepID=A0AAD7HBS4_9AGAR|nr:hypothetical protein B0H16DRAFT_1476288 [Mycena metata]